MAFLSLLMHGSTLWVRLRVPDSKQDQRGYSPCARPSEVADYAIELLVSDVVAFASALARKHFHVVGHDWGAMAEAVIRRTCSQVPIASRTS